VGRVDGEWARTIREDGSKGRVSIDRLLASDSEGNGVSYRFHGWKRLPRGYRTDFEVRRILASGARCVIVIPEWDPATDVDISIALLPAQLRAPGARGSCRADLTAPSTAGLQLHTFRAAKARGLSRAADGPHPPNLAGGQEYRRREDGKKFRLLDGAMEGTTVPAWTGSRVVRLAAARLLARGPDRSGLYFVYLGGGRSVARRRRAESGTR
jgi:hypothetical protein